MAPTFYGIAATISFTFWFDIGAWIERRSQRRG